MKYPCAIPCSSCPYRKDAPLQKWDASEFIDLMKNDEDVVFGKVYGCHKKDDSVCRGWLMNQDSRGLPSIQLRMQLAKKGITTQLFDDIEMKIKEHKISLFYSIRQMVSANFPNLLLKKKSS